MNNGYHQETVHPKLKHVALNNTQKTIWSTYNCFGPETRIITKLFRNANIKIAFKATNTLKHHLIQKIPTTDIYNRSGVYLLKCNKWPLKYIGQTGRTFRTRFKEHIHDIKNNRRYSWPVSSMYCTYFECTTRTRYRSRIWCNRSNYGSVACRNKGRRLNTLERFEIYKLTQNNLELNDTYTVTKNSTFDILIQTSYTRKHTPSPSPLSVPPDFRNRYKPKAYVPRHQYTEHTTTNIRGVALHAA
jgi:hypothetical protein